VLTDPGWEEDHGPSHPTLWKIYRQRLADPNLKAEFRDKMDVISCFRGRTAILNNPEETNNGVAFGMDISFDECFLEFHHVSFKKTPTSVMAKEHRFPLCPKVSRATHPP
jgi:hypothetical protein